MQQQTAANKQQRVDFAKKFASKVEANSDFLKNLIVSDEAHFQLSGFVNTHNARIWSDKQPYATHEVLKTREKVTVWMGLSYQGSLDPISSRTKRGRLRQSRQPITSPCFGVSSSLYSKGRRFLVLATSSRIGLPHIAAVRACPGLG